MMQPRIGIKFVRDPALKIAVLCEGLLEQRCRHKIEVGRQLLNAGNAASSTIFQEWLRKGFRLSLSAARQYMKAAELLDRHSEFERLRPSAIMVMAAGKTPELLREWVSRQLKAGITPTADEIAAQVIEAKRIFAQQRALMRIAKLAGKAAQKNNVTSWASAIAAIDKIIRDENARGYGLKKMADTSPIVDGARLLSKGREPGSGKLFTLRARD